MAIRLTRVLFGMTLIAVALMLGCDGSVDPKREIAKAKEKELKGDLRAAFLLTKSALQADPKSAEGRWMLGRLELMGGLGASAEKELRLGMQLGATPPDAEEWLTRVYLFEEKLEAVVEGEPAKIVANYFVAPKPSTAAQATAFALIGHAQGRLGAIELAVAKYRAALALVPNSAEALYGLGTVASRQQNDEEARSWLERAVAADPKLANAWTALGDLESRQKKYEAAARAFGKAAALRIDRDGDLLMRLIAHLNLKKFDEAGADVQELQTTGHRPAWGKYAQGLVSFYKKEYPAARDAFQAAIAVAPDFRPALGYLGYTHYLLGNLDSARTYLSAVAAKNPDPQLVASLASVELRLKNYAQASELASKALAADPNNTLAADVLGSTSLAIGDGAAALKQFAEIVATDPKSWAARAKLGATQLATGDFDKGFSELEAAADLTSNRVPLLVAVAQAYMRAGRFEDATRVGQRIRADIPDSSVGWVIEGGAQLSKRDIPAASKIFTEALAKFPGDPSASFSLAAIAVSERKFAEARRLYEQLLKAHPEHNGAELKLADLDLAEKAYPAAIGRAQKVLDKKPNETDAKIILAKAYAAQGDFKKTIELMNDVARAQPGSSAAAILGETLVATGQIELALPVLQKLVKETPNSADARYVLGQAYASSGDSALALATLHDALKLKPTGRTAIGMVRLLTALRDFAGARELLAPIRTYLKDQPVLAELDGLILSGEGSVAKAENLLSEAQTRFPKDRGITVLLARIRARALNPAAGIDVISKWLDVTPDDTEAHILRADLLAAQKRTDDAVAEYKAVAEKSPDNIYAMNNLAWLLKDSAPDQALTWADKAAQLAPESPVVLDTLGVLLLIHGNDSRRAQEVLTKASRLAPKVPEIQLHLAEAYLKQGNVGDAERVLKGVLAVDRSGPNAKRANELLAAISK